MGSTKRKTRPDASKSPAKKSKPNDNNRTFDNDRTFFQETLLMTHKRLGLSQNIITLLEYLDDVRLGSIDEDDLGRKIRLSDAFQKAIIDTITHCTNTMVEKPFEVEEHAKTVKKCTQMWEISRKPPTSSGLPFFKFPAEIRNRIYDEYFESQFKGKDKALRQWTWPATTACSNTCPPYINSFFQIKMNLVQTCTRIRDEVLPVFYSKCLLSFNCSCTMSDFFTKNTIAAAYVRSVRFHWRGPTSDVAIPCLYRCPALENLNVLVSKMTTYSATTRETKMKKYFNNGVTKISDANGIDELLEIRGLERIIVKQAPGKGRSAASKVTEETIWALERILNEHLLLPKPEGYGQ